VVRSPASATIAEAGSWSDGRAMVKPRPKFSGSYRQPAKQESKVALQAAI
jgi:hypothetical protein